MEPGYQSMRPKPVISMGRSPSPGGLSGFRGSRNPVQTAPGAPKTCPRSLLHAARRPKSAPRRPRRPPRRPKIRPRRSKELPKRDFQAIFGAKTKSR